MIFIEMFVLSLILVIILGISKSRPSVILLEYEQFVGIEPIFYEIPRGPTKNSHWFTHTFMRSRRKG